MPNLSISLSHLSRFNLCLQFIHSTNNYYISLIYFLLFYSILEFPNKTMKILTAKIIVDLF